MKLVSYKRNNSGLLGIYVDNKIYNLSETAVQLGKKLPSSMKEFLNGGEEAMNVAKAIEREITNHPDKFIAENCSDNDLLAPVPEPASCRDGYAFRQHVEAARRNRGVEMISEFDEYPVFYFTNHNAMQGPGEISCMPDHFQKLDFELEAAVVIGKKGMNVKAEDADHYIAGYMIMNDMSARVLQMEEMKLNLGPAKGKDFSTVTGPWLVTPDEIEPYRIPPKEGHSGKRYNLFMKCRVNGIQVSEGNLGDMDWTFAEIVERCSYGVNILPGDVIGSGTVGTGCFLELNGTGKRLDPHYKEQWLQPGDIVEMEIEGLGKLSSKIVKAESGFSAAISKARVAVKIGFGESLTNSTATSTATSTH